MIGVNNYFDARYPDLRNNHVSKLMSAFVL
jgi:hypothetical protein